LYIGKKTIMELYKSLVKPHLEYCIQVWNSYLTQDIKLIGVLQVTCFLILMMTIREDIKTVQEKV